jgi:arabinofuranan 3-O-arabinosyltransferase
MCCILLAALPFATAPGAIIADTKCELAVSPARFLSAALTLWNPQQLGVLTNQYVGYLFPMGPFFELLRVLGTAGWITQRLWLSVLLITAFGGTVRLTARMGVGTPRTRLAGGLAYALSPAALSILGQTSGEFLPMAVMPWIIVPLTDMRPWIPGDRRGIVSRVRAIARSAIAVTLCSGTNAASTIAVMVPCVLYILTRPEVRAKVRMLAWWVPAVAVATSSWSIPLVLLSKYGVSIVPFTESAQVTSSTTSLLNIVRGTEIWIGYLATNGQQPDRPLAFLLATGVLPAVLTGLLAALGLAGLVRRRIPEQRFLVWSLLCGVVIISLGYRGSLGNPLEGPLIGLINGPASPFRNLWKFDPMIRLPLAVGLTHVLAPPQVAGWRATRVRATRRLKTTRRTMITLGTATAIALGSLVVPTVSVGLASPGSFGRVPAYWVSAADWVTAHAGNQAVLVEPGAAFAEYTWGSPMDDVLQAFTNADYAERNLEVVGSVGSERLLDAIDEQFAAGDGSAGLTQVLARMGVRYVLVRNDLDGSQLTGTSPARIQDAIAGSPGLALAAQFGPQVADDAPGDVAAGVAAQYPAVEVYQVAGAQAAAVVQAAAGTLRVTGAPESLLTLAGEGILGDRPVLLNGDGARQPVAGSVVTDSLRRRVVNFGQLRTDYSPTLTAGDPASTFLSTDDFTEPGWSSDEAVAQYGGITAVTASSSDSDITAPAGQWATGTLPYAAFDGNAASMWESGAFDGPLGQWIQADFDSAIPFGRTRQAQIKVAFADNLTVGPPVTTVTVSTAAGQVTDPVRATGNLQPLRVPVGASDWLRITITGLDASPADSLLGTQVGITRVVVPGVSASRAIVAPSAVGGDASVVVLAKAQPYQSGCMLASVRWVCAPALAASTEEQAGFDHAFSEPSPQEATLRGSAVLLNPSLLEDYAAPAAHHPVVTASSTYTSDLQDQPRNAFDGNATTAWIASPADKHPKLSISWGYPRVISQVTIKRPPDASGLTQVVIAGSGGQLRGAMITADGVATFAPMKTTGLTFTFTASAAPMQVTDVVIPGVPAIRTPEGSFRLACGLGPQLSVDGQVIPTGVSGTFAGALSGRPLRFTACLAVPLAAGTNQVTEPASDSFDVQDVVLGVTGTSGASSQSQAPASTAAPVAATVLWWSSSSRSVRVAVSSRSYLEVNENVNAGWQAVLGGARLLPVRLDGWKQAWVLPAGSSGVVTLTYGPQAVYRDAVAAGLVALVVCVLASLALPLPGRLRRRRRQRPVPWAAGGGAASAPGKVVSPREAAAAPPRRRAAVGWLGAGCRFACFSGFGLLLGGYPGAVLVPAAAVALGAWERLAGWRAWLAGGLFVVASAAGAVGEHMVFSGDGGLLVTALSNAVPQVICLIVAGVLGAVLLRAVPDQVPGRGE